MKASVAKVQQWRTNAIPPLCIVMFVLYLMLERNGTELVVRKLACPFIRSHFKDADKVCINDTKNTKLIIFNNFNYNYCFGPDFLINVLSLIHPFSSLTYVCSPKSS